MLKNFRCYTMSVEFYRQAQSLVLPAHLKDQLRRAAGSICLNLAEGSGRTTSTDQRRFYSIALGSLRECQAILDLAEGNVSVQKDLADKLGAHLFRLIIPRR